MTFGSDDPANVRRGTSMTGDMMPGARRFAASTQSNGQRASDEPIKGVEARQDSASGGIDQEQNED